MAMKGYSILPIRCSLVPKTHLGGWGRYLPLCREYSQHILSPANKAEIYREKVLINMCDTYYKLNYPDQKIRQILVHNIWNHWTVVSTLLGLISSVYRDLDIKSATTECRAETLPLSYWSTSHTKIGNTHPHNYYNLKGKEIDVHFLF